MVEPDEQNKRIETILVLLWIFLWLQCLDEMNRFDEGLEYPDPGELFGQGDVLPGCPCSRTRHNARL